MKRTCHNHCPEHAHISRFYLYYVCCKNLMPELWTKIRLKFGREEILSHFWELVHVLYMYEIVRLCFTCFVLEVCSKDQRIRTLMLKQEARVFELSLGQRLKTVSSWAGLLSYFFSHPISMFTPPEPICLFTWLFWLFPFWLTLFIFSHDIKIFKIFFPSFFVFIAYLFVYFLCLYEIYTYYYLE